MEFEKVKISDLVPADYNPRKDLQKGDKEYEKIKNSIKEFGYVDPIIANADNTVIGGHQRLKVLKDLGYKEIDVVRVDVDKTKEKALNIALNKITGDWEYDKLTEILEDLDFEGFEIELTGFDIPEFKKLEADNIEIDLDNYDKNLELKLNFNYDEYHFIIDKLREIDNNLSKALLERLGYEQ